MPLVSLLMLDLDNTLVDRDAAFRAAVRAFLAEHGLPDAELTWVMALDASGYRARADVASSMTDRYGASVPTAAVRALLDDGGADRVVLAGATREALCRAQAGGWTCAIVSNGRVAQQEAKIRRTGLDRLVQGWVISEGVGHKKPEPEIFRAAAAAVGGSLSDAWVIGDSPRADIAGANALGLRSVWVSDGRPWTQESYEPTRIADDAASALRSLLTGTTPEAGTAEQSPSRP
ncbi:HAD family hydrolase [Streptomyces sp. NBC_01283]|uniref:HAD family hydrolase n=1 Tax=Streptomyces sp. NBC_01283 TaxID=2903812 RepID=UPI00352D7034|nr:HAD family hydrolase [Streptomyces sp. NBC_01283]